MEIFSKQYLSELVAEHKLVSASITRISEYDYPRFMKAHGVGPVDAALLELRSKKVQLEAKIDSLTEYLGNV